MLRRAGDASALILTSLADGSKHGYALIQDIKGFAGLQLGPGTLYGALDRLERMGKTVVRVSVRRPLAHGLYVEAERIMQAVGGTAREIAHVGGIGSLRGAHNAQNAACAAGAAPAGTSPC